MAARVADPPTAATKLLQELTHRRDEALSSCKCAHYLMGVYSGPSESMRILHSRGALATRRPTMAVSSGRATELFAGEETRSLVAR